MVVTLHRFFDRLFGDMQPDQPPVAPPAPRAQVRPCRGIPDGYLDKLPPPEERPESRQAARALPPALPELHDQA